MATKNGNRPQWTNPPSRISKHHGTPTAAPPNVKFGGASGFTRNLYGRGGSGNNAETGANLKQWVAGRGTSQQRYATTRLPGEF